MERELKQYLERHNFVDVIIPPDHITTLHQLFIKDIIPVCDNDEISLYCGIYYKLKKDYVNAIKYCLMAVNHNNPKALHNLADCYDETNDYANALKCWLLDIQQGGTHAHHSMNNCGVHYRKQGDYVNAVKYYLMADEHGNPNAMNNLAIHYRIRCDFVNAFKCWTKAVEHNNYNCASHALSCCRTHNLLTLGSRYVNHILNKSFNNDIIMFTLHFANSMDANLVNIIINLDYCQTDDELFNKFKCLLV